MARILGLGNPNVTGKIGNIDYTTYKQGVIAKAYQPKVFNPRSKLQVSQRMRFILANQYVKKSINESRRLYGTGRLSFERAALMQSFLKSRLLKNLGGNLTLGLPKYIILPNGENTQLFTTTGKSYSKDKLNIFDWGVTVDFPRNIKEIGDFEQIWDYKKANFAWLINGTFNDKPSTAPGVAYYFGCDYILPSIISVSQIVGTGVDNEPNFTNNEIILHKFVDSKDDFMQGKNRGLFSSLEKCGDGWKYYYYISGTDLSKMEASLYPARAVFGGKVISTVAVACVMIISARSNIAAAMGKDDIVGSSLDTVISITAQDVLNIEPTFTTPGE